MQKKFSGNIMESIINNIKLLELQKGKLEYKKYYLQTYTYKFDGFNEKFNEEKNDDYDYFIIRNKYNIDIDKINKIYLDNIMENNVLEYLLKCIRILQIENAKIQYEYDYLLEYIEEDNKYFNEDEDDDYLFRIKQFDDEIENIRKNV